MGNNNIEGKLEEVWGETVDIEDIEKYNAEDVFNLPDEEEVLPWPHGLVGDLAKSVYNFSDRPNKMISIVTALGGLAGIAGRRFNVNESGLNLYLTLLMGTGQGKGVIDTFLNILFTDKLLITDKSEFMGPKGFTGAKPLMQALDDNKCFVSVITEAGYMYKSTAGDIAGRTRTLLEMYTKSGERGIMRGERYSKNEDSILAVNSPCFSMINESTPKVFLEAMLGAEGTETGELTRMTMLKAKREGHLLNRNKEYKVTDACNSVLKTLMIFCAKTQKEPEAKSIHLKVSDRIFDRMDEYEEESIACEYDNPVRSRMLTRQGLKTLKIAALISVIDMLEEDYNHGCLSVSRLDTMYEQDKKWYVTDRAWDWAVKLGEHELNGLGKMFGSGEADPKMEAIREAYAVINNLLETKGSTPYSAKLRLPRKLIEAGIITRNPFRNLLAQRAIIRSFSHYNKPSVDCAIDYMLTAGYLKKIDSYVFRGVKEKLRGVGYRPTKKLLEDLV